MQSNRRGVPGVVKEFYGDIHELARPKSEWLACKVQVKGFRLRSFPRDIPDEQKPIVNIPAHKGFDDGTDDRYCEPMKFYLRGCHLARTRCPRIADLS